jgi:hypothetical protein
LLDQLHLYLGKKLIARGEMAEGILLLARTDRMFGTMWPVWYSKNARHVAFERATPADYDRMIALLDKADKTPLSATSPPPTSVPQTGKHRGPLHRNELSREKLLDYKATWYVGRTAWKKPRRPSARSPTRSGPATNTAISPTTIPSW